MKLQRYPRETEAEYHRRHRIMLAGYRDDQKTREALGSMEQATWWAGRCAADPTVQHPYVSRRAGGAYFSLHGAWSEDVEAFRAEMTAALGGTADSG